MTRPYRVGLTGGIGSGKSVVAALFAGLGTPVIDADSISRDLTGAPGPILQKIVEQFSMDILDTRGYLDRGKLRTTVFSDKGARQKLEAILHPLIYEKMETVYLSLDAPYCIFCIPLLLETDASTRFDRILVVDCPVDVQIERACRRDQLNRETVENIIRTQVSREDRLNVADDIIVNDGSMEDLQARVIEMHKQYLKPVYKPDIV
jgi:dephospho-CoA kinase